LTAVAVDAGRFEADLSPETISRTGGADAWAAGVQKNLERSLALGDRMGGHIVQGHVDRRVAILGHERDASGGSTLSVELPAADAARLVAKGSVAIDGVSLTVALLGDSAYDIALIPETLRATTLGQLERGCTVNVEYDVLGKYVLRALECRASKETTEPAG
jgi:riboflavin synthase